MLTITHKYLSSHETRKHRHIFARVAAFWQRVFQTLPNLDVHPGVAVYHALKIISFVNAKDLLMPHTKFQVCTLKTNAIFCHRKKKSHYFWTGVYITSSHSHHCANLSEDIEIIKCLSDIFVECASKIRYVLSVIHYTINIWGCVFSVYPFPWWWFREYMLCLIIIIKSKVWTIIHCSGLGHETMVCAVCLSILL